jgi:hypothetical protein
MADGKVISRVLIGLLINGVTATSFGNVGEPLAAAKAREQLYASRYRAEQPIFDTNPKGIVMRECWAAPPEMWTPAVAMALGRGGWEAGRGGAEGATERRRRAGLRLA